MKEREKIMNERECTEITCDALEVGMHFTLLKVKKRSKAEKSILIGRALTCTAKCKPFIIGTLGFKGAMPFVIDTRRTIMATITAEYYKAATIK